MKTIIDPRIFNIAPGFRAMSLLISSSELTNTSVSKQILDQACNSFLNGGGFPWAEDHLSAWGEVYRKFGAKPQRTPCSAEALRKRLMRDGSLPAIDPVVDIYNAISIKYSIPVGGENIDAYVGHPHLKVADGSEIFDTIKDGAPFQELVDKGEIIWCDDHGVTCRKWNWRQGVRTRIDSKTKNMWFILESLPHMPLDALEAATNEFITNLKLIMPELKTKVELLKQDLQ
ncbi:B3/B4 domain-containing protein [Peredibacter starrii]|uniref:B3/4 domain-containing protein n=1 Tax=Peredibacter starrii TaxID=28202 RepID=A0AAX4HMX9_9BACT|nr:B3/4 domain-containing protein [Peredibacter starrii]WPU64535.1 B3/4 domain-containing protein [Peredibacter starrii]